MAGRKRAKELYPIDGNTICQICNKARATDHHHIDRNTHNNEQDNIKKVCRSCHLKEDHRRGNYPNQTKLTEKDIEFIRSFPLGTPISIQAEESKILGISFSHFQKIKNGRRSPKPTEKKYTPVEIPLDYKPIPIGKPRALSIQQVKEITSNKPTLGNKKALSLSITCKVSLATIYKACGRQGCYSNIIYD